jgi:transposase
MARKASFPAALYEHDFVSLARTEGHARTRVRWLGLAHLKEGRSYEEVAQALKVHTKSVMSWVKRLARAGLEGVREQSGRGAKPKLAATYTESLQEALSQAQASRTGGRLKGRDIQRLLEEQFGVRLGLSTVYDTLKRHRLVWITARSKHPKHDPEAQEAFKENFRDEVIRVLPEGVELGQVDLGFQDEARVGQQGTLTRLWAPKGSRPRVVRQQQFVSAYLFGAVCPVRDEAVGLVMPWVNTVAMQRHLEEIAAAVPEGRPAVVMADRAGWHLTPQLKVPTNLSLLPLPTASPELNPAEQVWEQLRQSDLANRCYSGYEDIVEACCKAWNTFVDTANAVKKLCSRRWAVLDS